MLKLEFPNATHREMYEDMIEEWGSYEVPSESKSIVNKDFSEFLEYVNKSIEGLPGLVPATYFFLIKDDKEIVGHLNLRHHIEHPYLKEMGGHIGYAIVPWERGNGYGKEQLRLGLQEAKKLGLSEVMLSCLKDNIASEKIILSQGGKNMTELVIQNPPPDKSEDKGKILRRYWITL